MKTKMNNAIINFMKEMTESGKISGCAAAVYRGGKKIFEFYEGYAGRKSDGTIIPVTEHTVFRLASMTKPVTASAVLLCAERGWLDLDDSVAKYIPAFSEMYLAKKTGEHTFERGEKVGTLITLRQLLTHSAGLGAGEAGDLLFEKIKPRQGDVLASVAERYSSMLLDFVPASKQMYSPVVGLDVAARIVEIVSGMPYGEFVKKYIFEPLEMTHTSYRLKDFLPENIAVTYASENGRLFGEAPASNFGDFPDGYTGGGAGLCAVLGDYVKFAEAIRRSGEKAGGFLRPESVLAMRTPYLSHCIEGISDTFNWGLGVRVVSAKTDWQCLTPSSFGWSGAYGTHFWIDPVKQISAVYMHNSATYGGSGVPHTLAFEKAVMQTVK